MLSNKIFLFVAAILVCLLVGYALFVSNNFWSGPNIELLEGEEFLVTEESVLEYTFLIENASEIRFQDSPVTLDENMIYQRKIYLLQGLNHFQINARNFGTKVEKEIVVYKR